MISYAPTIISSSLKYITIKNSELRWSKLNRLFQCTPRLEYLSTTVTSVIDDNYISSSLSTLTKWNLETFSKFNTSNTNVFFQNMSNLCYLKVILHFQLIDGHQWKQIIRNYLPKLKIFRLKTNKTIRLDDNIEERANALINSFRDSFWIDEHKWFVRCLILSRFLRLFTHSYRLKYYETRCDSWKSTCPYDDYQKFQYDMVRTCFHEFLEKFALSHIHLPNIKYLDIKFPINDQFWSNIPSLNRLDLLRISSHADTFQSQLQALLNRAPHLRRLHISQDASLPLQRSLFIYTHRSIFLLDLHECYHYFNEEECLTLSRSPLGIQCEALFIQLNNRQSIISLVRNMINLRALNIYWNDDKVFQHSQQTNNNDRNQNEKKQVLDELVQWLKDELPSTYLISADPHYTHDISIWI
ncbi:unnamed protein product [Rotaria sordida]|uniref:F-box domain-containing protein n=1 Tax=Rotaria sordida TaxID=392033 RepID=A0A815BAE8_9BILA|nr:unnamed protein product [Rotaria sordida]CAF1547324.1 unnamed protein product [Rotaria sordida]